MCYIKTENVHYEINDETLLSDINISIKKGSIYGFYCENKETNTLLSKLLTGYILPTEGDVTVDSLLSRENSEKIREFTGIVSREFKMYSYMTGYNNLLFFGRLKTNFEEFIPDRASFLMHELNVWYTRDKKLTDVDSSSKRKLAIARALIARPSLLVLDEPFNKLDRGSQEEVKNFIKNIAKNENITLVICSENAEDLSVCDEFSVIKNGKCLVSGDFNTLEAFSGLKDTAFIRCLNKNLPETLGMEKAGEGLYKKELSENETISELIKSAVLSGADITEAIVKEPELSTVLSSIISKSGEGDNL